MKLRVIMLFGRHDKPEKPFSLFVPFAAVVTDLESFRRFPVTDFGIEVANGDFVKGIIFHRALSSPYRRPRYRLRRSTPPPLPRILHSENFKVRSGRTAVIVITFEFEAGSFHNSFTYRCLK